MELRHHAGAFGLHWQSDIALDGFDIADEATDDVPITVCRVDRLAAREGGRPINRGFVYDDGIRFGWENAVAFDMIGGTRIAYAPGPDWAGAMPASFYSTVAALTAAWRGLVPLHASAVEMDGRAILIAGATGAGKSTLTAELVALGARFVADDLTVLRVGEDGRIGVARGRPTIRLHPDSAMRLDTIDSRPAADDARGKWVVRPRCRAKAGWLAPAAIVLLEGEDASPANHAAMRLFEHLFRRRWLGMLPMYAGLMAKLLTIAREVPTLTYPVQPDFDSQKWRRRAESLAMVIREAVGPDQIERSE